MLTAKISQILKTQGCAGLAKKYSSPVWWHRALKTVDHHLLGTNAVLSALASFDSDVGKYGLTAASTKLVDLHGIKVNRYFVGSKPHHLVTSPRTIFVGVNHDSFIEPLLLLSLLKGDAVRIFIISMYRYIGHNFAYYTLPVLPKKYALQNQPAGGVKIPPLRHPMKYFYFAENYSLKKIESLNHHSLISGARYLKKGSVVIFPGGGDPSLHPWYRGIGNLIKLVSPELFPLKIVPISFNSLNKGNVTLHLHNIFTGGESVLETNSVIGRPIEITLEDTKDSPEYLALSLQQLAIAHTRIDRVGL